jgi:hypothetical protein
MESQFESSKLYSKISTFWLMDKDLITIFKAIKNSVHSVEKRAVSVYNMIFGQDTPVHSCLRTGLVIEVKNVAAETVFWPRSGFVGDQDFAIS